MPVLRQRHRQLPGLLSHPRPVRMAGDACQADPAGADLDHEQDVQRLKQDRLDGEEVGREDAGEPCARRNARQAVDARRGAGGR